MINHLFISLSISGLKNVYPKHQKALQDILDIIPSHLIPKFVQDSYSDSFIDTTPSVQSNTNSISSSTGQSHSYTQVLPFIRKLEYSQTQEGIEYIIMCCISVLHRYIASVERS